MRTLSTFRGWLGSVATLASPDGAAGSGSTGPAAPGAKPGGRAEILSLLEQGMISTEEALDLLDGLDQVDAAGSARQRPVTGAPAGWEDALDDSLAEMDRAIDAGMASLDAGLAEMDRALDATAGAGRGGRRGGPPKAPRPPRAARATPPTPPAAWFGDKRTFRVQVNDAAGSKVNLALPIGFVDTGLRVAERFSPGLMDGAVGTSIRRAVAGGQAGTIIEVDDGKGQTVRIAIE